MRIFRWVIGALAVALVPALVAPAVGAGAQETLQATISAGPFAPSDTPVVQSIDVCNRGASAPQINVVVTAPTGDVVIDQWHIVNTQEPGVVVNTDGTWSVELGLRDALGQPTGEPFPVLGVYTVQVDCVTTYTPQVRIPYNALTFEVGDGTAPPPPAPASPSDVVDPPVAIAPAAVPIRTDPTYTG